MILVAFIKDANEEEQPDDQMLGRMTGLWCLALWNRPSHFPSKHVNMFPNYTFPGFFKNMSMVFTGVLLSGQSW